MNQPIKTIQDFIEQQQNITAEEKEALLKTVKKIKSDLEIAEFKLERTEKVKRTTAILLEETIEELEHKRKAVEAQNRELEFETSLERVRTVAMSMQKPDDLVNICEVLYRELRSLGFTEMRNTLINTFVDDENYFNDYDYAEATGGHISRIPLTGHPVIENFIKGIRHRKDAFVEFKIDGKALEDWKEFIGSHGAVDNLRLDDIEALYYYNYSFKTGGMGVSSYMPLSEEKQNVLKRFRNVFDLAYRRFLDIEKAETQAREAQIEAALEKVRSRSLAMHQTNELGDVITVVFEKLKELDFPVNDGVALITFKEGTKDLDEWMVIPGVDALKFELPYFEHPVLSNLWEAKENGIEFLTCTYTQQENESFCKHIFNYTDFKKIPEEMKALSLAAAYYTNSIAFQNHTAIFINHYTGRKLLEGEIEILKRFARVFEQAYIRFMDLQKAEAQARESQIEASLESVRASAMAMHSSENLLEVIHVMREQMAVLEEKELESIIIHIYKDDSPGFEAWYSYRHASEPKGKIFHGKVVLNWTGTARARKDKEKYYSDETDYTIVADYDMLNEWYKYLQTVVPEVVELDVDGGIKVPDALYYNYSKFPGGAMLLITNKEASEDSKRLLRRSAEVFNLAYTRFLDLQKAEAQTREAVKQSSLDRIRAEIASMRSTEDLLRITPVIWGELTTLEVPFFRCGVFIMDEKNKQVTVYLSAPDGHSLGVMHLAYNANTLTANTVDFWRKGQVYTEHWDKAAFTSWMESMLQAGQIKDKETYQGSAFAPESLNLHFIPFSQGMLYVGNNEPLEENKIDLVKALAESFSIAYARYEDFNKLEIAKQQIEKTLVDLKQAQSQLIQSEKMASLGELTAGIAHEIQNPLNFVNNFSEVSKELLDEMKEELANGNIKDVTEIADDVIQNLEKILHHGKRADAIVKGMLQHSRSSTAVPEPTDINKLADEYLRLAYHGLRAKNKSFNAAIETEFDESIGNINIIPQDIGRVLLNLITNGFYAVTEKKKTAPEGYEPNLTVITKKLAGKISISVRDNGAGIPKNVVDKIFQPFFTTKPTGQGTGLGLSLSYDIVRAHGGELKVETNEGEGTTFIILLNVI